MNIIEYKTEANIIIQALLAFVIFGGFYSLMMTTKVYGGIIGKAIRLLGIGALFFTIVSLERAMVSFGVIEPSLNLSLAQDIMSLVGLIFLGLGFSKLASGAKV